MPKGGIPAFFIYTKNRMNLKSKEKRIKSVLPGLAASVGSCDLCLRNCKVDRLRGQTGFCGETSDITVYSSGPHHGEEPPLSGSKGSGTIFFSGCNMGCVYCQNYKFSQSGEGKRIKILELSRMMLQLQAEGCHNINLVSPTHFVPGILEALSQAFRDGLELPIVYNTGGYDSLHVIKALEGVVDVYLPDMRYSSDAMAGKYSSSPGYVANNRAIVKEMFRQVGSLEEDDGIAVKGLVIRLLVLPGDISGTKETLRFIASELGREVHISLMSQYYPAHKASSYGELSRRVNRGEYEEAVDTMKSLGMHNGWVQPFSGGFDGRFAGENFPSNV